MSSTALLTRADQSKLLATLDSATAASDAAGAVAATTASGPVRYRSRAADAAYWLTWAPPVLTNPIIVLLQPTGSVNTAATGNVNTGLDNTRDYIIDMPTSRRNETVTMNGGHHIWLIGGYGTIAGTQTDAVVLVTDLSTNGSAAPSFDRIVHIEGIKADASGGLLHDGIDVDCPSAIVQVQNCRVTGLKGSHATTHADIMQNQGGCRELRIDWFTGSGNYQGFFFPTEFNGVDNTLDIKVGKFSNVNLFVQDTVPGVNDQPGPTYFVWGTNGTTGNVTNPYDFKNFYVANNRAGQTVHGDAIWPGTTAPGAPYWTATVYDPIAGTISWPGTNLTGHITEGAPPNGDFVPDAHCGLGYVSPGYYPAKLAGLASVFIEEGTSNLCPNPGPASITGWAALGVGASVAFNASGGSKRPGRIVVTCDGSVTQQGTNRPSTDIPMVAGELVTVYADVRLESGTAPALIAECVERTSSGAGTAVFTTHTGGAGSTVITPTTTGYQQVRCTFIATQSDCAKGQMRIRQTGTAAACVFSVSSIQFEHKGSATTYCDGSLGTGYSWSGTADASSSTRAATRVNYPTAGHLGPDVGGFAAWVYAPALSSGVYFWSVGTPGVSGQDFIGLRINASGHLEAVFQAGTAAAVTLDAGQITAAADQFISCSWSGTAVQAALNRNSSVVGTRAAVIGSLNTPMEVGALTDGSKQLDGYVGPVATFTQPISAGQRKALFNRRAQWALSMLPDHLTPELLTA